MNRQSFFEKMKSNRLFTEFSQLQVDTIDAILDECEKLGVTDIRQMAYIFATAYHECYKPSKPDTRMTPMPEFGGEAYLKSKPYYPYYGRGLSQLTWKYNYAKEATRLNIDLLNTPELMLVIDTAANSHVYCMKHGRYTGKKLSDYINDKKCDFVNARRIINGTDKAIQIAGYAEKFLNSLS